MGSSGKNNNGSRSAGVTDVDLGARGHITVDIPLIYSADSGSPAMPRSLQEFERKRRNSKIEYGLAVTADGNVIEERRGGKGSVRMSMRAYRTADYYTHIHPRSGHENEQIGGTFSDADINNFTGSAQLSYRAVASEGTYSITKTPEMRANPSIGANFARAYSNFLRENGRRVSAQVAPLTSQYKTASRELWNRCVNGEISRAEYRAQNDEAYRSYVAQANRVINVAHINSHNWLLEHQREYGYTYGLER